MALIINTNIENQTNGYLLDSKNIKGGYISVNTASDLNNLPDATITEGSLVYVISEDVYYKKINNVWIEVSFNGGSGCKKVELTKAEYDALVQSNADDKETDYYITDYDVASKNSSGGGLKVYQADYHGGVQFNAEFVPQGCRGILYVTGSSSGRSFKSFWDVSSYIEGNSNGYSLPSYISGSAYGVGPSSSTLSTTDVSSGYISFSYDEETHMVYGSFNGGGGTANLIVFDEELNTAY